jgi:hypothetical protein
MKGSARPDQPHAQAMSAHRRGERGSPDHVESAMHPFQPTEDWGRRFRAGSGGKREIGAQHQGEGTRARSHVDGGGSTRNRPHRGRAVAIGLYDPGASFGRVAETWPPMEDRHAATKELPHV